MHAVSKWRRRYEAYGVAGPSDAPRPGRPRTVLDEQVQAIIGCVRQSKPAHPYPRSACRHPSRFGPNAAPDTFAELP
ncbi:MAG: helix-turn-helix domain-containing protein [Burkholderiales bacterium]|nr:helix-turn-helix domain-containing protein [Burkholderiales bacterium]